MPRLKPLGDGAPAHLGYARMLFDHGRDDEALQAVNRALDLDPRLHLGYFLRAEIQGRDSRPDLAERDYLTCMELSPRFADGPVRLGDLLATHDRYEEALAAYEKAIGLTPEVAPLGIKIASAWFGLGVYARAVKAYKEAIQLDPGLGRGGHTVGDYHALLRTIARCHARRPAATTGPATAPQQARQEPGPHPSWRADLSILPPAQDGSEAHMVKDSRRGGFFELSPLEAFLCRQLDGRTPPSVIRTRAEEHFAATLPDRHLQAFLDQLTAEGLLLEGDPTLPEVTSEYQAAAAIATDAGRRRRGSLMRVLTWPFRVVLRALVVVPWDILSMQGRAEMSPPTKVEMFRSDRFFTVLARLFGWCITPAFVYACVPLFLAGLYVMVTRWNQYWFETGMMWRPWQYLMLAVVGVLLVHVPHQLAHGLALTRFGGHVRGCGIRFMMHVVPTFYCDLSDALWLRNKSHRLWTIGAGIFYQVLMMTLGMVGWALTPWGGQAHFFWACLSTTAAWGLLFNANPAIRRDLYFVLSGWLEIRNLRERAVESLRSWVRWLRPIEPLSVRERNWFRAYASIACLYGLIHLAYAGSTFAYRITRTLEGPGMLLFLVGGAIAFQDHFIYYLSAPLRWLKALFGTRARKWTLSLAIAAVILFIAFLPYPYQTGGPFVLLPAERLDVRVEIEGMVEEVMVKEGEVVKPGQPVARISKRLYERNLKATEAQVEERMAQLSLLKAGNKPEEVASAEQAVETARTKVRWSRSRAERIETLFKQKMVSDQEFENALRQRDVDEMELLQAQRNLAVVTSKARSESLQAVEAEISSLKALIENYRTDIDKTVLVAPIAGRVITPRVEELVGMYLKPGQRDLLLQIENSDVIRAEVEVPEEDAAEITIGASVKLAAWTYAGSTFKGRVTYIAPIATTNQAQRPDSIHSGESTEGAQVNLAGSSWKVVRVMSEFTNPDGHLKADMTGYAKIATRTKPVWDVLLRPVIRWFQVEFWYWIP